MDSFSWQLSGSAHRNSPIETFFGLVELEDGTTVDIPQQYPFAGPWGEIINDNITQRAELPTPIALKIVYLSVIEKKFYAIFQSINPITMKGVFKKFLQEFGVNQHLYLIVGMAPYGGCALFLGNKKKQVLLGWFKGGETYVEMEDFLPEKKDYTLNDYCNEYINSDKLLKTELKLNGIPSNIYFDKCMQQFSYRYLYLFEHWDKDNHKWYKTNQDEVAPTFDNIEEVLVDGTFDKLHDDGLLNYHKAGKPKTLSVKWHIKKSEYTAYFWFEDEEIRALFDRFYGAHPETKTDFMIRIDSEKNKYELALYRYGLKEPQVISESAYQLLVFKNKFECYRSENYNQPKGAWIW